MRSSTSVKYNSAGFIHVNDSFAFSSVVSLQRSNYGGILHLFVVYTRHVTHYKHCDATAHLPSVGVPHRRRVCVVSLIVWLCTIISIVLSKAITVNYTSTLQKHLKHLNEQSKKQNVFAFLFYYSKCHHMSAIHLFFHLFLFPQLVAAEISNSPPLPTVSLQWL